MTDNYRQELVDQLGELAWSLDAQGRKADSLTCTRAAIELTPSPGEADQRVTVAPNVDGQDFYELCQAYRHSKEIAPHPSLPNTVQAFNNLREYIKTGKLPWPSYERSTDTPQPFSVEDGYGNGWECIKGKPEGQCGLEVVRPGKVQCDQCDSRNGDEDRNG